MNRSSPRFLLIDADIAVYSICSVVETEICWDEQGDIWTIHTDLSALKDGMNDYLKKLKIKFGMKPVACLTGSTNWRHRYYPEYKSHRKKVRKPLCLKQLKEWIKTEYDCLERDLWEADDICGYMATKYIGSIVVSRDKDLKSIPGTLYNDSKDKLSKISLEEADYLHKLQTLTGDPCDGYSGIPGVGAKTAERILSKDASWKNILKTFKEHGLDKDYAFSQAAVARILRFTDYSIKKDSFLWTPGW